MKLFLLSCPYWARNLSSPLVALLSVIQIASCLAAENPPPDPISTRISVNVDVDDVFLDSQDPRVGSAGLGFNRVAQKIAGSNKAITFDDLSLPPKIPVDFFEFEFVQISSLRDLLDAMNVSASASYRAGWGGARAEVKLSRSLELKKYYFYALLRARAVSEWFAIKNPQFLEQYAFEEAGAREFFRAFGDTYVSRIKLGGSVFMLVEIRTESSVAKEDVQAAFAAKFPGGRVSGDFASNMRDVTKNNEIRIKLAQRGGQQVLEFNGVDDVGRAIQTANDIRENFKKEMAVIELDYAEYRNIRPGLPYVETGEDIIFFEELASWESSIRSESANLNYILSNPFRFVGVQSGELQSYLVKLKSLLEEIIRAGKKLDYSINLPRETREEIRRQFESTYQAVPLPSEDAMVVIFDLPNGHELRRTPFIVRKPHPCWSRWQEALFSRDFWVTDMPNSSRLLTFQWEALVYNRAYSCGGDHAWDTSNPDKVSIYGNVTAELREIDCRLAIENIATTASRNDIEFGKPEELVQFIKSKNGSQLCSE